MKKKDRRGIANWSPNSVRGIVLYCGVGALTAVIYSLISWGIRFELALAPVAGALAGLAGWIGWRRLEGRNEEDQDEGRRR